MKNKERIALKKLTDKVFVEMREQVGGLILNYIQERSEDVSDFKLNKLKQRYEECGGSANQLLSKILPKRVKLLRNGSFNQVSFVNSIIGAMEYVVVYDCEAEKLRIEEAAAVKMLPF